MPLRLPTRPEYIAFVSSSIAKRLAERFYDKLAAEPEFQKICRLPASQQLIAELALASLGSIISSNIRSRSIIGQFAKNVLDDVPSELARRMRAEARAEIKESAVRGEPIRLTFSKLVTELDAASIELAQRIRKRRKDRQGG